MMPDERVRGAKRTDDVREMMRSIRDYSKDFGISSLLLNQINRDGVQAARKNGRYFKGHLAESAWVEQSSDVVYALYQSQLMRREQRAQLQQLKGRRTTERHWELVWRPEVGDIRIEREIHFDDDDFARPSRSPTSRSASYACSCWTSSASDERVPVASCGTGAPCRCPGTPTATR
jgi:hypothetical protein